MPSPSNRELLAAVRAWATSNYPGCPLEFVTIHCRYLAAPIQLADGPTASAGNSEDETDHKGMSPIILDILAVLREATRPLSRTLLLEELAKRGKLYNERSVAGYLSQLVQDGTLENPAEGRPRGYRISAAE